MRGKYIPQVSDFSVFKEIASNISNPLEILREAISNSDDANANIISICIDRNMNGQLVISIEDNGEGMGIEEIHKFYSLGFSDKSIEKIGEKGIGAKAFYKSEAIHIETYGKDEIFYIGDMYNPWEKLQKNEIPEYVINECEDERKKGTKVVITSYKIDNPEKFFNLETIKDYIQWFTIGGSFRNIFADKINVKKQISNIDIVPQIAIYDKINNKSEIIAGIHKFEEPNENMLERSEKKGIYKSREYARTFGPFNRETNINEEFVSVQIYGTVSGISAKKKICKLESIQDYKERFGLYLSKDFIPCIKMDKLLNTEDYHHYHIVVNSQNFKLTSDRNNISNIDDIKVKWVLEQVEDIINTQIKPIANREYFAMIKKEEDEYKIMDKCNRTKKNMRKIERSQDLEIDGIAMIKVPRNEFETALLFTSLLSSDEFKKYIPEIKNILSYSAKTPTDMICINSSEVRILVEVEYKLSNFLKHRHPIETVDYIVCWSIDLEENKLHKINDKSCIFIKGERHKCLAFDEKELKIIELENIIKNINSSTEYA